MSDLRYWNRGTVTGIQKESNSLKTLSKMKWIIHDKNELIKRWYILAIIKADSRIGKPNNFLKVLEFIFS